MNTRPLEKFAQFARRQLHQEVAARLGRVLSPDSLESRARPRTVNELRQQVKEQGKQVVVERVAYTWFNRFCALRFMDANRYTRMGIVSPLPGQFQPEILQEAKQGHMDADLPVDRQRVFDLLSGRLTAPDAQQEAYRLLLVAACNQYHQAMPFLFEKIDDYSELLVPDDLLSGSSILAYVREAMTPDTCQDVEVIGWLYQFYISEKKDQVIGAKAQIQAADIPAATQLFTPHWIVRYLVENSLGHLWMLNRPGSRLAERMEYYIASETGDGGRQTADSGSQLAIRNSPPAIRLSSPTDIRLCDPAAGSGHILTYAFDLLHAIYEEEGYPPSDIPRLILTHNLHGMEIDERAGGLAAFALTMKARQKDQRFLGRGIAPHICVLRPLPLTEQAVKPEVERLVAEMAGHTYGHEVRRQSDGDAGKSAPPVAEMAGGAYGHEVRRESDGDAGKSAPPDLVPLLLHDLTLFAQADNLGALLRPRLGWGSLEAARQALAQLGEGQMEWTRQQVRQQMDQALAQAQALARKYHVVVANPPYMGGGNANDELKEFAKTHYPDSKADLFAMFIERNLELARRNGLVAMITMQSWMFLSSYEKLRARVLEEQTILSMAHLGARAFDSIGGEVVSTTAFVLEKAAHPAHKGAYLRLIDGRSEAEKAEMFRAALSSQFAPRNSQLYRAAAADFKKIPGSPIAYWVPHSLFNVFQANPQVSQFFDTREGLTTGNNERHVRFWYEVNVAYIGIGNETRNQAKDSRCKWFPYNKGGEFRKWFGNDFFVVNWFNDGFELQNTVHPSGKRIWAHNFNLDYIFKNSITWSDITTKGLSVRRFPNGYLFDATGLSAFRTQNSEVTEQYVMSICNSKIGAYIASILNPTMHFKSGDFGQIPLVIKADWFSSTSLKADVAFRLAKTDWDSYEISWNFADLPLLRAAFRRGTLAATYAALRAHWQANTDEMQRLEEENNRLFIAAYGLQDELTPDVPLAEITLTCNPHYRYNSNKSAEELESLLLADTLREFISYAVGCMFGRYSLDRPGLVLADAGEGIDEYMQMVVGAQSGHEGHEVQRVDHSGQREDSPPPHLVPLPVDAQLAYGHGVGRTDDPESSEITPAPSRAPTNTPTFPPDADNVIPILDGDWFPDEISERFKRFLRVTFGEAGYAENLRFIESALGRDIRSYFLREFYDDHIKRYQKRPIYWLFSSPKGSFNALIYLHRYRPDTVSVVLNEYLREFRAKLTSHRAHLAGVSISAGATPREKTQALKEIDKLDKTLAELQEYEDGVLYPLATRQVEIDLDDGVKVNYNKLGSALKKVTGLSGSA